MKMIVSKILGSERTNQPITIVSGLPRSGTSMMMRMLEAGGMPVVVDNRRKPDQDNPLGYYEFEPVKKIEEDDSWLASCRGKAVKLVSALLYHLPGDREYKVIFMRREMQEILASQKVMWERLGQGESDISDEEMARNFGKHLHDVEAWLKTQGNIDTMYVKYNDVITYPYDKARSVQRFLGKLLNPEKMARVVEKRLHRQRKKNDG